jgi:protein-disulfide isomerase
MKGRFLLALATAVAIAAPAGLAPTAANAQAQRDWTRTVVATPEGGFRMGNPSARLRIVEFVSLTCPHCRNFAATGGPQIIRRVRSGEASFELRSFVLNPFDAAAALVNRCASPQNYFALNDAILAEQPQWVARLETLSAEQARQIEALPDMQRLARLASIAGVDRIAARFGVTPQRARACLTDPAGLERLATMRAAASQLGVGGTPSFLVNGGLAEGVHDWAALEPLLSPGS